MLSPMTNAKDADIISAYNKYTYELTTRVSGGDYG
jgi:hypothetical protein